MNNELLSRESKNSFAVVMVTGVIGLEQRLSGDRSWTLSLMERDLTFIQEQCAYYEGRVVKYTDFGLEAEFADVAQAVKCGLDIQKTLTGAAITMEQRDVLGHSIGIHGGDLSEPTTKAIALQLQLMAHWGTIHISEGIYSLAATTLGLGNNYSTNYVGERYLQKIYQVLPRDFSSSVPIIAPSKFMDIDNIEIIDDETEYFEPSKEIFDQVVDSLESNNYIIEIKQLLLYICLNKWESDRLKLEKLNLKGLIQELIELTGTYAQLKFLVNEMIQTIDQEYTLIAGTVITELSSLYKKPQAEPQNIYEEVIQSLEDESKDVIRIKKLLFYICKYDQLPINTHDLTLEVAIRELQKFYPTLEALRVRMKQALAVINQSEYTSIMDVVIDELSAVYPVRRDVSQREPFLPLIPQVTNYSSNTSPSSESVSNAPTFIDSPVLNTTEILGTSWNDHSDRRTIQAVNEQHLDQKLNEKHLDAEIAKLDLFDVRLEIIKYISPLRVKILIFSALNNVVESTNESVTAIRTYELDNLLRDLFYAYKNPQELKAQLKNTAKQFKDIDEYEQATDAIMSAVMTIYYKLGIETKP